MITLNEAQRAAVEAGDGPALVLAGAGSGKTRVIIERLVYLVEERGIDPRHLLALTFTNKAAAEMRARFAARLEVDRVAAWLGTFHSFGLFILRRDMDKLGRPKAFTIFDDSDQLSLMKRLIKDDRRRFEELTPREALAWISRQKQTAEAPTDDSVAEEYNGAALLTLWERYHNALQRASAVDFDDLLVLVVRLFEQCPEILVKYQRRYKHVLIDEYQDTNHAQYLIARHLCGRDGNLFVVGDEDQSIYSWRGADISNILDFASDFPDAVPHRLEENYRSTKPILDAANALVANNINRLGKKLFTSQAGGEPVRLHVAEDGKEEAKFVVRDMVQRDLAPRETAVLYRTNAQARLVEEALRTRGVHYVVVGGIRFYSRKEIKDILCYLRLLVNPDDDESLRRVLNVPPRGIGGVSLERIEDYALQRNEPILRVLRETELDDTLSGRARRSAAEFVQLIDDLTELAQTQPVADLVEDLLERIGYLEYVQKSDERDFRDRLDIVDEFITACRQYDAQEGKQLNDFLQDLALMSDVDQYDPEAPAVTLMTCHSAKGLEFDNVYLIGLEEGMLPLGGEFDDDQDIEEERRLCYVAMTRARNSLTLCAAKARTIYGRTHDNRTLSRFLHEVGPQRMQAVGIKQRVGGKKAAPQRAAAGQADANAIKTGTRIRHARFGRGYVMYTKGTGDTMKARIRFDTGPTKMLMVKMAPIEILKDR